jgi:uncharacterized protein DUF4013
MLGLYTFSHPVRQRSGTHKRRQHVDIGRSFTYITEDEEWWKKVLIGGLLSLIPIVGQFYLMGYVLATLKNVIDGREIPLPEPLDDFGDKLIKGLLLSVITFIYFLPITLIGTCSGAGAPLFQENIADPDTANTIVMVWSSCFGCISFVLGIATSLLLPFVWSKYAETGQFGDAFKLGEIFGMLRATIGQAVIVVLVGGLAAMVAGIAGLIACGVGLIFTTFYAQLVTAFLYGSVYRQAKAAVR